MRYLALIAFCLIMFACGGPVPRRPVEVHSGSFMKESIARNKDLLAQEEEKIKNIIAADSLHSYIASASGSWYYYLARNEATDYTPIAGDLVTIRYNILSLENDTIYSMDEIGVKQYLVDREDRDFLFPGLRNSVKLLKAGEAATFLFPSSLGYGYQGDQDRIGPNVPLKSTISLDAIEKQKDSVQN